MSERGHPELGAVRSAGLTRRELLRRAVLVSAATAAAATLDPIEALGATMSRGASAVPTLDVLGHVTGLTRSGARLVATVSTTEGPQVWAHELGSSSWAAIAAASAFPGGTDLFDLAAVGGTLVAVGHIRALHSSGTYVEDTGGPERSWTLFAGHPAIFASADGSTWTRVYAGDADFAEGIVTSVVTDAQGALLAAGGRYPEPGVFEPFGLVALASPDGLAWERRSLDGVAAPDHGDVSLLAQVGDQTLLATTGFGSTRFYTASGGAWTQIAAPEAGERVSFMAAGRHGGRTLVSGVDDLDVPHFWALDGGRWREVRPPAPVPADAKVSQLLTGDGVLVAAGSTGSRAFAAETEGRS